MVHARFVGVLWVALALGACDPEEGSDGDSSSGGSGGSGGGSSGTAGSSGTGTMPDCGDDVFAVVPTPYAPNTSIEEWGGFAVDDRGAVFSAIPDPTLTDDISAYNPIIMASDLDGNLTTLYTGSGSSLFGMMSLDGDDVYMLAGLLAPSIARMPRTGGTPVALNDHTVWEGPVDHGGYLYYAAKELLAESALYRLDKQTDTSELLVSRGEVNIDALDIDVDTIYWLESDPELDDADYTLFRMPVDGDSPEQVATVSRDTARGNFRVIDGVMFGSELTDDLGVEVHRTPIGEAAPGVVETFGGLPLVIAGGFAYYASGSGGVTKAPLSFASKTTIPGSEGRGIYSIAIGPDDLWYSEAGCIYRAPK